MADRLNSMIVQVSSPDQQIIATVSRRDHVALHFSPGAYRSYDEATLESQLARLATSAWASYQRRYAEALSEATGDPVPASDLPYEPKRRDFQRDQAAVVAHGTSPSGWIRARSQGLMQWRVTLEGGVIRRLTEEQFLAEAGEALRSLLTDYYAQVRRLKDEYFDLELPENRHR